MAERDDKYVNKKKAEDAASFKKQQIHTFLSHPCWSSTPELISDVKRKSVEMPAAPEYGERKKQSSLTPSEAIEKEDRKQFEQRQHLQTVTRTTQQKHEMEITCEPQQCQDEHIAMRNKKDKAHFRDEMLIIHQRHRPPSVKLPHFQLSTEKLNERVQTTTDNTADRVQEAGEKEHHMGKIKTKLSHSDAAKTHYAHKSALIEFQQDVNKKPSHKIDSKDHLTKDIINEQFQTNKTNAEHSHHFHYELAKTYYKRNSTPNSPHHFQETVKQPTEILQTTIDNVQQLVETVNKGNEIRENNLEKGQEVRTEHHEIQTKRGSRRGSIKLQKLIYFGRIKSKSLQTPLNCARCENYIEKSEADSLLLLLLSHSQINKSSFKCEICLAWRSSQRAIKEHMLQHFHNKQIYCTQCRNDICELSIKPLYNMKNHVNFIDAFVHKTRGNVSPSRRNQWLAGLPRCKKCGLVFDYSAALMQKVIEMLPDRWATDKVVYKCHKCGVRSPFMKSIQEHVVAHINYGEIVCMNCQEK